MIRGFFVQNFDKSKCDKYIEDNITVEYSQVGNENNMRI